MKKIVFLSLIISLIIVSCTQQQEVKSLVEGAWQVVSWQRIAGDTLNAKLGRTFTGTEMKIWSKNCFNFVGRYDLDTTMYDNYGGGTYKLDGTHCEESYLYFGEKSMVGTSQRLLLEIKNDTLIQTWPCDANWQIDKSNYNIQKLTRKE
jgi:hypothetical protein